MSTAKPNKEWRNITVGDVTTPDGDLYYTILLNDDDSMAGVISTFGKSGTSVAAWAYALDQVVNLLIQKGAVVNEIIDCLSGISTSKPIIDDNGIRVGSGPDGLVVALMEYKRMKFKKLREEFEGE